MRIRVSHDTTYRYDRPVSGVIQLLRLTPRNFDGQYVSRWRIDISADCPVACHIDAFGNYTHSFTAEGPLDELVVHVEGEAEIDDTHGVISGTIEPFPPALFLRETPLTVPNDEILAFAQTALDAEPDDILAQLHVLSAGLNRDISFDTDPTHTTTTAAEAFAMKRGVCQDISHIFVATARAIGIPARYVSGYLRRSDGVTDQEAGHAWAEAHVSGLGWVAFDPTHGVSATDSYVRVATGLDYLSAAPVRGTRFGGAGEHLDVQIRVEQAMHQSQN
jgi:transglutaminase-like putative cysteine protease